MSRSDALAVIRRPIFFRIEIFYINTYRLDRTRGNGSISNRLFFNSGTDIDFAGLMQQFYLNMNGKSLKFLFIEPFFGGSHRQFARGLAHHSRHDIELVTLPARFWKWRMRGAALTFIKQVPNLAAYDGLITSGLMSLADFKALAGPHCPPALVYFHENQLTYPLAPGERMDYQYGFTNITTALAARQVLFNSCMQKEAFLGALPGFIKMMPDSRPGWVAGAIAAKVDVLYPGCNYEPHGRPYRPEDKAYPETDLLIVWNHRWEFDKDPDAFFQALDHVLARGKGFRLALLGENYNTIPSIFEIARQKYGNRIVHYGYAPCRADYLEWLKKGDIVISTAQQENFGISMVEAVRYGCFPLLPHRLSYPEIIPARFHDHVLYQSMDDLVDRLCAVITRPADYRPLADALSEAMARFAWENVIDAYDEVLEGVGRFP